MGHIEALEEQHAVSAGEAQGARRASGGFPARGESERKLGVDPEVPAKARRRQFAAQYKQRVLREADAARGDAGQIGALLRREGLYSSHLVTWRRARERGELAGLSPKRRGRKVKAVNPLAKRVVELERDKRRLERRLKQAELLLEIQKKASQLLEIPLASRDDEDGSA
jgi:transposase-like protein